MKINYIVSNGKKLFSFHRHHFNFDGENFIDGGFDYTRASSEIFNDDVENLIEDLRTQFEYFVFEKQDGKLKQISKPIKDVNEKSLKSFIGKYKNNQDIWFQFRCHLFQCELDYRTKKQKASPPTKVERPKEGS